MGLEILPGTFGESNAHFPNTDQKVTKKKLLRQPCPLYPLNKRTLSLDQIPSCTLLSTAFLERQKEGTKLIGQIDQTGIRFTTYYTLFYYATQRRAGLQGQGVRVRIWQIDIFEKLR